MKGFIRELLPRKLRDYRMVYLTYGADIQRYYKSLKFNQDRYRSEIIMICHVLEKGLTMPQARLGFGESRVHILCNLLIRYDKEGYDPLSFEMNYALMILNEYLIFHEKQDYKLKSELSETIEKTISYFKYHESCEQLSFTREEFIKSSTAPFPEFSQSRYTVRNYLPEVPPVQDFIEAVKLAQNAPSSCNRQPVRVYIITKPPLIKDILEIQGGSRGFGNLATVLLVITSNISFFPNIIERSQPSLNAGFFGMALLYALHSKQIGAATLNWSQDKRYDSKLRSLLDVPENEQINFLVSCGYLPEKFNVAASVRRDVDSICRIIKE